MENKIVYSASTKQTTEEIFESLTSIEDLKVQKKLEINQAFEQQIVNGTELGYLTQGLTNNIHVYDASVDLSNYNVALQSMQIQNLTSRQIKVKEVDPFVTVTQLELQTILAELVVFGDGLWVRKQALYSEISQALSEESIAAILW